MNDTPATRILLATHVLGAMCDKHSELAEEDRAALLALAQDEIERALPLRLLAALVLDRERHRMHPAEL